MHHCFSLRMSPSEVPEYPPHVPKNPFRAELEQLEKGSLREQLWRASADYADLPKGSFGRAIGLPEKYEQTNFILDWLSSYLYWPLTLDLDDEELSIPAIRFLLLVSGSGVYISDESLSDGFRKALFPLVLSDDAFAANAPYSVREVMKIDLKAFDALDFKSRAAMLRVLQLWATEGSKSSRLYEAREEMDDHMQGRRKEAAYRVVRDPETFHLLNTHKGDVLSPEADEVMTQLWGRDDFREALRLYFHYATDLLNVCSLYRLTQVEKEAHFFQMTIALDGSIRDHISFLLELSRAFPNSIGLPIDQEDGVQIISFATEVSAQEFPDRAAFASHIASIAAKHGIDQLDCSTYWDKDENAELKRLIKTRLR